MDDYQDVNAISTGTNWDDLTYDQCVSYLRQETYIHISGKCEKKLVVPYLRCWIQRLNLVFFGSKENFNPKNRADWKRRPNDWPEDVRFADPNNYHEGKSKLNKVELTKMFYELIKRFKAKFDSYGNHQVSLPYDMGNALPSSGNFVAQHESQMDGNFQNLASVENFSANAQVDDAFWNVEPRLVKKLQILKPQLKKANWEVLDNYFQLITTIHEFDKTAVKEAAFQLETSMDNFYSNRTSFQEEEALLNIEEWKARLHEAVADCQNGMITKKENDIISETDKPENITHDEKLLLYDRISELSVQDNFMEPGVIIDVLGENYNQVESMIFSTVDDLVDMEIFSNG